MSSAVKALMQRVKNENEGPKDHYLIAQHGRWAQAQYFGPCTKAHAEQVKADMLREEEMYLTVYPPHDPDNRWPLLITIQEFRPMPKAFDPPNPDRTDLFLRYADICLEKYKHQLVETKSNSDSNLEQENPTNK